jgi:rod shape-determining protein MreC
MRKLNSLLIFGLLAVFLLIFSSTGPLIYLRGQAQIIASPLTSSIYQSTSVSFKTIKTLNEIRSLAKDNAKLKKDNNILKSQVANLKESQVRYNILEKEYSLNGSKEGEKYQTAQVIGRSPSAQRDILTLNKGSKQGIKKNQPVLSDGFLIGKISEVRLNSSQAELITNSRFIIPVVLQNSRQTGLLRGGLKGIIVEQLPNDLDLTDNEMVITSGLADQIPGGIPVGTASRTISQPSDIFKTISLVTPVDFSSLEIVFVLEKQ